LAQRRALEELDVTRLVKRDEEVRSFSTTSMISFLVVYESLLTLFLCSAALYIMLKTNVLS